MGTIEEILDLVVSKLSDQNYAQSFAFYRSWFDIGHTYHQISSDRVFDAVWRRIVAESGINPETGNLFHSTDLLVLRFMSDVESDCILAPHNLRSRLCTRSLQKFFSDNLPAIKRLEDKRKNRDANRSVIYSWDPHTDICVNANLIARWANLGCVEEAAIRIHILQSLISHQQLYDHQADALIMLFKLAGATFEAYANPSVVDRCFELLKDHYSHHSVKGRLVQEVIALRERGWEGLPPPSVFTTGKPESTGVNQKDPAATPVATPLGLPNVDFEPQIPHPSPFESVTTPESDIVPITPVTQSPSISIASLSDFTIADTSDGESPISPAIADTSDDGPPLDPTTITPHDTFYLEDGNVEVLCGNTLFRIHAGVLPFHSPVLGRMFARENLATAESPNGCPRIPSSDTVTDFTTLLKIVYLPAFPERNKVPDFTTFSSLLQITAKYEIPAARSQMLDVVRDAYPEAFEGLAPSKSLGESFFSGPTPYPNEVLNLFVQQKLTSALPMACYMAARRGLDSLMNNRLPASARLSPGILQAAIRGLMTLREMELKETHRLILGSRGSRSCSKPNCPSRKIAGPGVLEPHQKVVDKIVDSAHPGTKLLQVLSSREVCGSDYLGLCESCVEGWEAGHAAVRRAWTMLPNVFGLKG